MNSMFCRVTCVSVLGFWSQVTVSAQPEVESAAQATLRGMQSALHQVSLTPHHLLKNETAGLHAVIAEAKQHVTRLAAAFETEEPPIAYLEDLMLVSLRLSQLAMHSSFSRADLGALRDVEKDLRAKRLWAERNPAMPGGSPTIEFVASADAAQNPIVICVQKTSAPTHAPPLTARGKPDQRLSIVLVPGVYRFWRAAPESEANPSTTTELVVDGARAQIAIPSR